MNRNMKKDLVQELLDKKAESSNTTDLNAYANGLTDMFNQLNTWNPISNIEGLKQGHYLVRVLNSFPKNCNVVVAEFYEDNNTFYSESSDYPIKDAIEWKYI